MHSEEKVKMHLYCTFFKCQKKKKKKKNTNLKVYKNKQTKKKTQQTNKEKNSQLLTKVPELVTYTCLTGAIYSALSQLRVG